MFMESFIIYVHSIAMSAGFAATCLSTFLFVVCMNQNRSILASISLDNTSCKRGLTLSKRFSTLSS